MNAWHAWLLSIGVALAVVGAIMYAVIRLGRHRGMLWLKDSDGTLYRISIHRLVTSTAHSEERSLNLVIACDGVFMELNIGNGEELLHELYAGRTWLFELEEANAE